MPLFIPPEWEYWVPDKEIEEILINAERRNYFDDFSDVYDLKQQRKYGNAGFRFGKGNPNFFQCRLAPERHRLVREEIPPADCKTCGTRFQPDRKGRLYCSTRCVRHEGAPRALPDIDCAACGAAFRPDCASRKYCSQQCVAASQSHKAPDKGCRWCGGDVPPSTSRNQTQEKVFCKRKCARSYRNKTYRRKCESL